jgi:type IX secretion system PorP/SprF family membrane protein
MKYIYSILLLFAVQNLSFGQQDLQMSHYLFNGLYWNPGYAGSHDYIRTAAAYRHQWTAMKGAPKTLMVSADIPFKLDNMGVALQIVNDRLGVTNMTEIYATYAYHIKLKEKLRLGLGIKAGISNYSARLSELTVWDAGDDLFTNDMRNIIMPKIGFGAYLHSDKYYVGISIPTLWAYSSDYAFSLDINKSSWLRRHIFASAAYVFDINEDFKIKPSVFTKFVNHAPFQLDINATLIWKDMLHLTLGYRSNAAALAMIEVQPISHLRFGYAFDLSTPQYLRMYGGTTHEIMVGYDIVRQSKSLRSPRHF